MLMMMRAGEVVEAVPAPVAAASIAAAPVSVAAQILGVVVAQLILSPAVPRGVFFVEWG